MQLQVPFHCTGQSGGFLLSSLILVFILPSAVIQADIDGFKENVSGFPLVNPEGTVTCLIIVKCGINSGKAEGGGRAL